MKIFLLVLAIAFIVSGWLAAFAVWPGSKSEKAQKYAPTALFIAGLAVDIIAFFVPMGG